MSACAKHWVFHMDLDLTYFSFGLKILAGSSGAILDISKSPRHFSIGPRHYRSYRRKRKSLCKWLPFSRDSIPYLTDKFTHAEKEAVEASVVIQASMQQVFFWNTQYWLRLELRGPIHTSVPFASL